MISTADNTQRETLKQMKQRESREKEEQLKKKCEEIVTEILGKDLLVQLSNQNKGIWYSPVQEDEDGEIELIVINKPINRHILNFASTKLEDDGLYTFLEACMRECFIAEIDVRNKTHTLEQSKSLVLNDDDYFIPSAQKFNKIMGGKRVAFLKR